MSARYTSSSGARAGITASTLRARFHHRPDNRRRVTVDIVHCERETVLEHLDIASARPCGGLGMPRRARRQAHAHAVPEEPPPERIGRVECNEAALQHADARRHTLGFVEIVRRDDDRVTLVAHCEHQLAHEPGRLRVEAGRRLVQQDHRR